MISLEKCEAYLNECQALGAEGKLTLRRATAVSARRDGFFKIRCSTSVVDGHCPFPLLSGRRISASAEQSH